MTSKKKSRLGRGLGALLGDVKQTTGQTTGQTPAPAPKPEPATTAPPSEAPKVAVEPKQAPAPASTTGKVTGLRELPIELLQRGKYQPRINMDKDALEELSESIRVQGIIQPLLVRQKGPDQFEIIAGERRWRGAQLAGLATVPAVVRDINDETAMAVALIENIQRQDLNAIEEALGFQRLLDEFGLTHEEVAESVGRSRTAVTNTLRLLKLHAKVREMVETGDLGMGHARALLVLPEVDQLTVAKKIVAGGMSVRKAEHLAKRMGRIKPKAKSGQSNQDVKHLEQALSDRISAKVEIKNQGGKGKLIVHYHSLDELDGILERIR